MGRRDSIIKCNGYNPKFKGWGYEDDEFPFRISKLGYVVGRTTGIKKPCWHLHHFDGSGSKKETQPYYDENNTIYKSQSAYLPFEVNTEAPPELDSEIWRNILIMVSIFVAIPIALFTILSYQKR